ncbi:Cro/CI family transcriptional regulator [Parasphingorhabdus sp.]|uniref:Cro/CI family transcriptional regulator n=1 Tax=Parasphingorhabdus sp. TaxID=2709688 RepID=UPI003A9250E4
MYKQTVIDHFGGVVKTAEKLGITHAGVSRWGEIIPKGRALEFQLITKGALKVDLSLYKKDQSKSAA